MKRSENEPIEPTAVHDSTDTSTTDRMRKLAGRTFAYGRSFADVLGRTAREGTSQLRDEARLLKDNPRGRSRAYQDRARWAVDKGREQAKTTLSKSDKAVDWTEEKLTKLLSGAQEQFSGRMDQTFTTVQRGVSTGADKAREFIRRNDADTTVDTVAEPAEGTVDTTVTPPAAADRTAADTDYRQP
ncbi:hypothetical protein [Brevibacterium luteolum]|uniref:Uncharacterized protein n=1 Tax=Brevibacterium luteolum TaxID=199591 RepID=A0A2N6PKK8_9MICO|nr:hypothetical protein [Brevibacterium luteolum]MBM7528697.1 hypothetical protein [Brevibacterium luteolum]MCT1921114.1 hypothetical protein [Brevibacterium luteolum]NNG79099.1 hypothetical protein [Brevibacterium luteolum]PMB99213.1 hypothetical protein CJ198_01355 [Brevibacterium luteolum]